MAKDAYWTSTKLLLHCDEMGDPDISNLHASILGNSITASFGTANVGSVAPVVTVDGRACFDLRTSGNSNTYVGISGASGAAFDGDFTLEWWFYQTSSVAYNTYGLAQQFNINTNYPVCSLYFNTAGDHSISVRNGNLPGFNFLPPLNQWNHHALVVSGGVGSYYVNGVRKSTGGVGGTTAPTMDGFRFGYAPSLSNSGIPGYLSGAALYKGIAKYSGTSFTIPSWPPLKPVVTPDTSPAGAKNQSKAGTSLNALYTADSVYGGGCLNFDGFSWMTLPGHADFNFGTGDYTVEFFIKVAQRGTDVVPIDYYMVGVSSWQFIVKAAGNITIYEGNPNVTSLTGVRFVADNVWHHIALCRKAGILTLFIDGSVDMWIANTKDHSGTPTYLALGAQINSRNSAYDFIGKLDEVRITKGVARYSMLDIVPPTAPVASRTCTDPYWDKVVLSMHMEGTHGANSFVDVRGKTTTPSGGVVTSTSAAKFGNTSAYFPGGAQIIGSNHADLQLQVADFTIEAWINIAGGSGPRVILGKAGGGGQQSYFFFYDGSIAFLYTTDGWSATSQAISYAVALTVGTWYHVAVSRQGTNMYLFLDGVLVATKTDVPTFFNSSDNFRIGAIGVGGYEYYWNGYIDDLRVTKGVARYTTTFTPPAVANPDPVTTTTDPYWNSVTFAAPLKGVEGSVDVFDIKGNVATLTGAVALTTAQGKFEGSCLKFTGGGTARVTFPHNSGFSLPANLTGEFTFEAWVMLPAIGSQFVVAHKSGGSGVGYPHWTVGIGTNGYVYATCFNGTSTVIADSYTPAATMVANVWAHIAFVKRGSMIQLFVNGVPAKLGSGKFSTAPVDSLGGVLGLGWDLTPAWNTTGYMSDVRITQGFARYVGAFTPAQPAEGASVVSGTVRDAAGVLCSRTVNVHSRATGRLLGTAVSDPVTGVFEIGSPEQCYAVILDSTGAYNSLILDRLEPVL